MVWSVNYSVEVLIIKIIVTRIIMGETPLCRCARVNYLCRSLIIIIVECLFSPILNPTQVAWNFRAESVTTCATFERLDDSINFPNFQIFWLACNRSAPVAKTAISQTPLFAEILYGIWLTTISQTPFFAEILYGILIQFNNKSGHRSQRDFWSALNFISNGI